MDGGMLELHPCYQPHPFSFVFGCTGLFAYECHGVVPVVCPSFRVGALNLFGMEVWWLGIFFFFFNEFWYVRKVDIQITEFSQMF